MKKQIDDMKNYVWTPERDMSDHSLDAMKYSIEALRWARKEPIKQPSFWAKIINRISKFFKSIHL